ncbi:hypothetical protein [Litoribaculum gwangyangense]|uniref:Uncharacterized protein n=1 Tax=Litoribaculum gwangyangense TaxID=1130722 RepID=A0ABP9BY86_9FLAO
MVKKLTVIFEDKREPLTLLYFKDEDLFIGYLIQNGTEILKKFAHKTFNESVAEIKAFLDDLGGYGIIEKVDLDKQIKTLLEKLSEY